MNRICKCDEKYERNHDWSTEEPSMVLVELVAEIEDVPIETIMDRVETWQCEHLDGMVMNTVLIEEDCLTTSFKDYKWGYCVHFFREGLVVGIIKDVERRNARDTEKGIKTARSSG